MERAFKRDIAALDSVFEFVSFFSNRNAVDKDAVLKLSLAIEELFVNMVRYNPAVEADIVIGLRMDGDEAVATLKDPGARPFDPTRVKAYDVNKPIAERAPGGLGVHLVRSVMDGFSYECRKDGGLITLTKRMGKADV
jgi:anti-sigma regulatory factor (Ser/Thr protein kinase)